MPRRARNVIVDREHAFLQRRAGEVRGRRMLFAGVSALALLTAGTPVRALQLATMRGGAGSASAAASAAAASIASVQQAQTATRQSMNNLLRATQAVQAMQQTQAAARALARPSYVAGVVSVPNGLTPGGLQVAPAVSSDASLWQNANLPTQSTSNGQTNVTIKQTAQKAILTWNTFNVGERTTVDFDQSGGNQTDGNNNWIALNRIVDPSGAPSQILGQIKAQGSVYLINANGIIFGGASQVNVHTLVASSLSFLDDTITSNMTPGSSAYDSAVSLSNAAFLNASAGGIASPEATGANGTAVGNLVLGVGGIVDKSAYVLPGAITIEPGASIATAANGAQSDGGFVLIAAPSIDNEGSITTPEGQAILAAGIGVSLQQSNSSASAQFLVPELTGQIGSTRNDSSGGLILVQDFTPAGTLVNNGLIQATTGNVTLLGTNVSIGGTVETTTSVSTPGSITISTVDEALDNYYTNSSGAAAGGDSTSQPVDRRAGQLNVSGIIANLPEDDGQSVPSDSATFVAGKINLTGGSVWLENNSLIEAPGASVSVAALTNTAPPPGDTGVAGRVYVDNGATIDVGGLANVELPVSDTLVTIGPITANDLADAPLQRNSFLLGRTIVVDSTISGVSADGQAWVGTPIVDAEGYVEDIPYGIDQLLTNGGAITLSGNQVMTASGSSLNLDGGYVHYQGGIVATTRLIDASGALIDIANADPNDTYVGVAGQFSIDHAHWGVTQNFTESLLDGSHYEPDYIQGGNAGTLNVFGTQAVVLDGAMTAAAFPGLKQIEAGLAPAGTPDTRGFLPEGGSFDLGVDSSLTEGVGDSLTGEIGSVIVQSEAPSLANLAPGFGADTPLDIAALNALGPNDRNNILDWTTVPAAPLSNGGFQTISVTLDKIQGRAIDVAAGTTLVVQAGGSITFQSGAGVEILGNLIAPAGKISIAVNGLAGGDITLGPDATLNVAGEWVNDGQIGDQTAGATTFINGGSVTLSTDDTSANNVDTSGSIILQKGSVIDLASGGALLPGGVLVNNNGIPEGRGGSLSLLTYYDPIVAFGDTAAGGPVLPASQPAAGRIVMDGTIDSIGFSGGGTLTLQALGFQVGGDPSSAPSWDLYLPADFFASQGFGKYQLNAMYDAAIAPGTTIRLTQENRIPDISALAQLATGGDVAASGRTTLGTVDAYDRQATDLVITAGGYLQWSTQTQSSTGSFIPTYTGVTGGVTVGQGAAIIADAGASVGLGSPAQVTVLGSIIAPGGSITLSADKTNTYGFSQAGQITLSSESPSMSVWLGADAVLDVAGVALVDPYPTPVRGLSALPTNGEVLAGGSVVLSDDNGIVVAQAGSVIDVSGAEATFDEPQGRTSFGIGGGDYAPQQVWSDAGSITLAAAAGLYFDGTLEGHAGAAQGEGGMLTIQPEVSDGATTPAIAVILQQSGSVVPAGLAPGGAFIDANGDTPSGTLQFSIDRLSDSGIETLVVGGETNASGVEQPLVPVAFAGNVDLSLGNAIVLNTTELVALAAGTSTFTQPVLATAPATTNDVGAPAVSLNAPYVEIAGPVFGGGYNPTPPITTAALGNATLSVNAKFVDLENQLSLENFGNANFTSSGDIRLSSPNAGNGVLIGSLYTPGNLSFSAADLYPASGETFIIDASGSQASTITFQSNGPSTVPLSAGGTLLIDATNIIQAGTIRAPSGTIVLGVGDKTDSATQTQFNSLPLTDTQSVTLASGSVTSVSLDGTMVPYGTTTDGLDWQYDAVPNNGTDLTAPPAKVITIDGANVSLNSGATVDLSGGGDLYATEWVAGTGGSRDVLSQYNVTYPASGAAVATPLYPDARNIYAIVPSYEAPVAAYDPVYAQVTQPGTNANGTATTQTESSGVGQASINGEIGQSVYLAGVPGLAAGTYVLLPAKYATLPGAYRVVQNTGASNVVPGQSVTLPDGTQLVSGYYVDALSGARSAIPVQFQVQSAAVWGQYSQYTETSANSYFASQAQSNGTAAPPLPMDAGDLTLAATSSLILNTTLKAAAAPGGLAAEVNIASQDIEIVGQGEQALSGYLQISTDSLDALGAGSLLVGGTRTSTANGVTIDAIANSVVVANNANDPLTGPEIILVTKVGSTTTDPNAATGLQIDSGSVIEARGSLPASAAQPITIGQNADSSTNTPAISGDGALLRVSNAGQVDISRDDLPTNASGSLTVQAGANIEGGAALTLDASGTLSFAPSATFSATNIAVDAPAITLTNATGAGLVGLQGFVVGPQNLGQFANAEQVDLRSYGAIIFDGSVNLSFGQDVELSAGTFQDNSGGAVTINAPTVAFTNDLGATAGTPNAGAANLVVNANEIDLGGGSKALEGFDSVNMTAAGGIVGQNTGSFDMGSANVTLAAPIYLADTSSEIGLTTTGALNLDANQGTALALNPVGGAISFTGGSLSVNGATISAPAGNVSLEATTGDLDIASGSLVSSQGVSKLFFDVTEYAPAGNITLTADEGSINVAQGATLNFAGATDSNGNPIGGAAGTLTLSAPIQSVNLDGSVLGSAALGYQSGSFSLNTGGSVDLDNLAVELAQSGVTESITVETNQGNLILSAGNSLTAHLVSLTADGGAGGQDPNNGNVVISGTINASGIEGGTIDLYGKSGVDLEGSLIARACLVGIACNENLDPTLLANMIDPIERGGTVEIGAVGVPNTVGGVVQLDPTYGYELVSAANSGVIKLGSSALIDVSGGTAGGLSEGTVSFRAPLLDSGDVNVNIVSGAEIAGSRATTLEAFAVWSTDDPLTYGATKHFDGIVDPAGWYGNSVSGDGQPGMVAGTWTDQSGNPLPNPTADQLASYLQTDLFTPTAANPDHQTFYGYLNGDPTQGAGTLMGFVENFPISSTATSRFPSVANFSVTPGIELDNPDPTINNGNISILTNWNLGAGSSPTNLAFRFDEGGVDYAPDITFRAENDVKVDASLSDGFFQIQNPTAPPLQVVTITAPTPEQYSTVYDAFFCYGGVCPAANNGFPVYGSWAYSGTNPPAAPAAPSDPALGYGNAVFSSSNASKQTQYTEEVEQYYGLYTEYLDYLTSTGPDQSGLGDAFVLGWGSAFGHFGDAPVAGQPLFTESAPTAAQELAAPNGNVLYLSYLHDYETYITNLSAWTLEGHNTSTSFQVVALSAPPIVLTSLIQSGTTTTGTIPLDNTPSPVATSTDGLPLMQASLNEGSSSSFNVIAGANLSSANPLALQASALINKGGGSVVVDGHFSYVDANGETLNAPTMIRTGTGSIDVAAADDVTLADTTAPGVIYTAGEPAEGTASGSIESIVSGGNSVFGGYDVLATNAVNPDRAGDISIQASNDITGVENVSGTESTNSQFWWQWMQTGNVVGTDANRQPQITQASINFGAFDQGVMSVGGNVTIAAGGNVTNFAVSLPTTWYLSNGQPITVGGGNLTVTAGGNILSGNYFVASGTGTLTAGGLVGANGLDTAGGGEVSTLLATQDGIFDVSARLGVDIGGMVDPSYVQGKALLNGYGMQADAQSYSTTSALNVISTTGEVSLNTLSDLSLIGAGSEGGENDDSYVLPATVQMTAFGGGIDVERFGELYPSATGELSLVADQSINLFNAGTEGALASNYFGLIDAATSTLPSPLNPIPVSVTGVTNEFNGELTSAALVDHSQRALHADDSRPVQIYSLTGSITDGTLNSDGSYGELLQISVDKPAEIEAAQNIVNLAFQGQNLRDDDVTSIKAARDIYDGTAFEFGSGSLIAPALTIGGPGTFDVEAGRNIGPLVNDTELSVSGAVTGIEAIGNTDDPFLPHESANIQVLFGTGPGVDTAAFVNAYIIPGASVPGIDTSAALVAFMEQYDEGKSVDTGLVSNQSSVTLTANQAWSQFQALPQNVQRLFAEDVLFDVLQAVGNDYNNSASPFFHQYERGYQAINTLFPASYGYTANGLDGGTNGANSLISTGNLDIRSTTIQTQQGGNVSILGPGGEALVGSQSAPPAAGAAVSQQGILTLEQGSVDIFTDQSLLLAQSRIFTEEGGDMTIWSSNGDINAGKGAKTVTNVPAPIYVSDENHYNTRDARGEVSGAGISTVPAIPGVPRGNVDLIAPRGTVDAGAAGIRVSGNLNIAALQVLNAFNIQVQGVTTGVPTVATPNVGALSDASAASGAATKAITAAGQGNNNSRQASILIVEIEGYGGDDGSEPEQQPQPDQSKQKHNRQSYNENSHLQVVGLGTLTEDQKRQLTASEQHKLVGQ